MYSKRCAAGRVLLHGSNYWEGTYLVFVEPHAPPEPPAADAPLEADEPPEAAADEAPVPADDEPSDDEPSDDEEPAVRAQVPA